MSVNNILCVGRGGISKTGYCKPKQTLSNGGFKGMNGNINSAELKLNLHEPRILPVTPRKSRRDTSPPTKSILRSKSPSPKQGSPLTNRNVRFCEKDGEFSKIHVNESSQTDTDVQIKPTRRQHDASTQNSPPDQSMSARLKPLPYQTRTSTPRYNSPKDAPSVDFDQSLDESPQRSRSPVRAYQAGHPVTNGKLIDNPGPVTNGKEAKNKLPTFQSQFLKSNYNPTRLERKDKPNESHVHTSTQTGQDTDGQPDGNRIIRNLDLSASPRSLSPVPKPRYLPDGHQIVKNMDLSHQQEKSHTVATQTNDDDDDESNESVRSQSPDFEMCDIPDGDRIVQNFDISKPRSRSVGAQTGMLTDFPSDGNRIIRNIELSMEEAKVHDATTQVDDVDECEMSKSESTQVDMDSPDDSIDSDHHRSIGIQAPEPRVDMPDGSRIIKNMDLKNSSTKRLNEAKIHDPKWSDFIKKLDLDSSSSSQTGDNEPVSEPVLVYDKKPDTKVQQIPKKQEQPMDLRPCEKLSEHSAQTLLEGDVFTKRQLKDLMRTELNKLQKHQTAKQRTNGHEITSKSFSDASLLQQSVYNAPPAHKRPVPTFPDMQTFAHRSDPSIKSSSSRDSSRERQKKNEKYGQTEIPETPVSLGFTPIETYSFKPENLARNAMKLRARRDAELNDRDLAEPTMEDNLRESLSKNLFIQGLDLGPIPGARRSSPARSVASCREYRSPARRSRSSSRSPCRSTSSSSALLDRTRTPERTSSRSSLRNNTTTYSTKTTACMGNASDFKGYPSYRSYLSPTRRTYGSSLTRASSMRTRPSTSPLSRHIDYSTLTPTLSQMRSTMARKNSTGSRSDSGYIPIYLDSQAPLPNTKTPELPRDRYSSPSSTRMSRYDSFRYQTTTNEDALLKQWSISPRRSSSPYSSKAYSSTDQLCDKIHIARQPSLGSSRYMYTDSLHDSSNKRPASRSPMRTQSLDKSTTRRQHVPSPHRVIASRGNTNVDSTDSCVSVETSGSLTQPKTPRGRPVFRKPPLPRKSSASRSRDRYSSSRSRERSSSRGRELSGSTQVYGREPSKCPAKPLKDHESAAGLQKSEMVTIGKAPERIDDPSCLYLGHDTIQKIIDEAAL